MIDIKKNDPIYKLDPWKIIEEEFNLDHNYRGESIFSLSNGYIGMRGTFEEAYDLSKNKGLEGNFVNGYYESQKISYGELAYAYPEMSQTMLNIANGKILRLTIGDEKFSMLEGKIETYERILDFKDGVLQRRLIWVSPMGKRIHIEINRMVSLTDKHLAFIQYKVKPLNFSAPIHFYSEVDGDVMNSTKETNSRIDYGPYGYATDIVDQLYEGDIIGLTMQTLHTKKKLACIASHQFDGDKIKQSLLKHHLSDRKVGVSYEVFGEKGQVISLTKYLAYIKQEDATTDLLNSAKKMVLRAEKLGFSYFISKQKAYLEDFWFQSDVEIEGDLALQQGIRFNLFQLLQSIGKDGETSVGAKGLSGEGYEGHCFWDTEMYIMPFFTFTNPELSKKLLMYRYHHLDEARERAKELSYKGALYPWRTINGKEASCYFLAGTAQVHINADIAYAVNQYMACADDDEFLRSYGCEMLIETARFWLDYGDYIERKDNQFCINGVTGPDEFSVLVDNNCYTNLMARENLYNAVKAIERLKRVDNDAYDTLVDKVHLEEREIKEFKHAADNMYIPYDETLGIYPQDDYFLCKKPWDFKEKNKLPLLDHYHPMVVYRYQISKQADLILAMFLLEHYFTRDEISSNFNFYDKVTIHESSLSACIFSIVANHIGEKDKAYEYFMTTARLDVDDYHHNTNAGIHTANMGGTWMSLVNGFGGVRIVENKLSLRPTIPKEWKKYRFRLNFRGRLLDILVDHDNVSIKLIKGNEIAVIINGDEKIIK